MFSSHFEKKKNYQRRVWCESEMVRIRGENYQSSIKMGLSNILKHLQRTVLISEFEEKYCYCILIFLTLWILEFNFQGIVQLHPLPNLIIIMRRKNALSTIVCMWWGTYILMSGYLLLVNLVVEGLSQTAPTKCNPQ